MMVVFDVYGQSMKDGPCRRRTIRPPSSATYTRCAGLMAAVVAVQYSR